MPTLSYDDEIQCRKLLGDVAGILPGEVGLAYAADLFTGDGGTIDFNLSNSPNGNYPIFVYLNGVLKQNPEVWSQASSSIQFVSAPGNGVVIKAVYYH